ncbi:PREDICTED: myosin-I heavy chain-like [Papilio xuthus]|uniref:Myosin-I heavy chain-like n=1 Tax=Papilio xuthus TaxID=66420 RepID=A0AAJ6ZES2_PAPXU|nr:PREDICTED: myosin-I heavy chain-like [Papilio xuthus]
MEDREEEAGPGVPDMTMMPEITEAAINDNLRRRYVHDLVYTYTGSILVAVNPYKELGCYTMEDMQNYRGKAFGSMPPHVFALAESAYSSLQNGEKNQSVVISGESGAGKTETTKLILQYLCAAGGQATWAEQQILEANTVLEAFGNAKTVRNDNSSRFGKFVEVRLDHRGGIRGAVLRDFLLERARITGPAPRETNYHVFYQLLEGAKHNAELRSSLRLRDDIQYKYLRMDDVEAHKGRGGEGKLEALQLALTVLQVPPHMCEGLFKVLAAILWLGNIQFQDVDGERSALCGEDTEAVEAAAWLLGLAPPTARRVLLERQINVRGNVTDIPLRLPEARENRHAMARALYARTFAWLVRHVNSCSAPGRDVTRALGVLDIFGFENFATNSLEQLCINYANEKLHMFFNNYVFALEQEIYRQEGIIYNQIQFTDNGACLELLEKPPRSLLKLLSEQCHMPKGSDGAYLTNIQCEFGDHQSFVKGSRRKWEEEFGVQHYAGTVTYSVHGFVDKNRDTQQDAFIDHLSRSANPFVRELADYAQDLAPPGHDLSLSSPGATSTTQRGTSKGRPTVVDTFRAQLQSLVDMLQATDVWYVRCIKPNENKEAGKYSSQLVLEQLRYLGMNEIVRIRRDGYPVHLPAPLFRARYRCLLPHPRPAEPQIATITSLVNAPANDWQIGHTKIFMRSSVHSPLEAKRTALLQTSALRIQKWFKGSVQRRSFVQRRNAAVVLQAAWRGWKERAAFLRLRRAALTLQRHLRGAFAREVAAALREMRRVNDEMKLREERNSLAEKVNMERAELETMADQLRGLSCPNGRAESVNLDNLFDFLADVPAQRGAPDGQPAHQPTIAEIGDSMERLADDLHQELEHVLAAEMNELSKSHTEAQRKPDGASSDDILPPPPSSLPLQSILQPATPVSMTSSLTNGMTSSLTNGSPMANGDVMSSSLILPPPPPPMEAPVEDSPAFPSPPTTCTLPEPAGPPPPPPAVKDTTPPELTNGIIPNGKLSVVNGKEPIYESVIPRPPGEPPTASPPPPPLLPPESNGFPSQDILEEQIDEILPGLPSTVTSPDNTSASALPTDSCTSPPPMMNGDSNTTERNARRKERVERRLHQMEAASPPSSAPPTTPPADINDLADFAKLYFNDHPRSPEGTIMATLTRKSKSMELLTKEEMITYHKGNNIPTSHIQLHDPDSVTAAVNIFRDLCRYMRGELTSDKETQVIQSVIGKGLEREELRDEILIQCVRQITECPVEEWAERVWLVLCLSAVAWQPSRGLARYYCAWLRARARAAPNAPRAAHCAQWCLDNCRGAAPRLLPPSTVEIAAMRRLGTIVCRFFFLDGRTKAIDVHPADTAAAAAARLADKLGLAPHSRAGWAVYQQRASREDHVRATHYLYDVIAAWEMQQGPGGGSADNRFVFKRRLFRGGRELPHDPVEVALLYAQAVHSVVKMDEFPVSEKVALQLAGLQAQVSLGEPPPSPAPPHTRAYYAHPEQFLPQRIARARPAHQWATILAQAHRQYGAGRAELTAKALYLSCVMQYPLYGVTLFPVTYKGYWAHGPNVLLGVGAEGVVLVRPADKAVLAEYPYNNIAALLLDPVDSGLTISLTHHGQHDGLRCIVLESAQKQEAAWLMAAYSPPLANGLAEEPARRAAPAGERARLAAALRNARRALVDSGLLRRPTDLSAGGFLRNTLRRLSKHRLERVRLDVAEAQGESYKGFPAAYWSWARALPHSLTKLNEAEEVAATQIFKDIMSHAGLNTHEGSTTSLASTTNSSSSGSGEGSAGGDSDDRVALAQALLQRCLQKDTLLCELYMQLIKQTTDHPEPSSRVSARHWALLCAAVGAALPPAKPLRRLLLAHLRYRGTALHAGEEGKFARRAEQVALSIAQVGRRNSAPSREELLCAAARRPMHVRVLLLDGKQHGLVFGPAATADHLVAMLREKIGLSDSAAGYALYEVCANSTPAGTGERALAGSERVGDVLARWEKAGATAASCRLVFKKRLFLGERPLQSECVAEMELLYYQLLHAIRHDRLPIETDEAVMVAALHAQVVSGECSGEGGEECLAAARAVLPPRPTPLPAPALRLHHLALRGTPPHAAMQRALTLAASWPLARATVFDVMQSFTSNWPRALWLAVDARGLTLLRRGSRSALVSHDHDQLLAVSPAPRALLLVTRADRKHAKLVLSTDQAYQIATLIKDYIEAVRGPVSPAVAEPSGAGARTS